MSSPKDAAQPPAPKKPDFEPAEWFWKSREKGPKPWGTEVFTALRLLDLPLQYYVLRSGLGIDLIRKLGGTPVSQPLAASTTVLGLSPYQTLIFSMAVGSAAKQIYWKVFIGDTVMPISFSTIVAVYNTILNSFNTVLSLWAVTSNQPAGGDVMSLFTSSPTLPFGIALYAVGIFTEWWCEIQRKAFKADPANKDKPYTGGLFGLATNINYGGYTLWRTGYSLVCAGLPWGCLQAAWLAGDFCGRAIPSMEAYCKKRVSGAEGQVAKAY